MVKALNFRTLIAWLQQASVLFVITTIPFRFNEIQRWATIIFVVASLADIIVNKRYASVKYSVRNLLIPVLLLLQYLLLISFYPIETEIKNFGTLLEMRMCYPIVAFIALFYTEKLKNINIFTTTFTLTSLYIIAYTIYCIGPVNLINADDPVTLFNETRHLCVQAHMAVNIFFSANMLLLVYTARSSNNLWVKVAASTMFILLYILIVLSGGRIGFLSANIICACSIWITLKQHRKTLISIGAVLIIVTLAAVHLHPKKQDTMLMSKNIRSYIWQVAMQNISQKPVTGYGASTAIEVMRETMLGKEAIWNDEFLITVLTHKDEIYGAHAHNQMLQSQLEYGILGTVAMILLLLSPFYALNERRGKYATICFWIIICLQLTTDVIDNSLRAFPFTIYLLLLLQIPKHNSEIDNSSTQKDSAPAQTSPAI